MARKIQLEDLFGFELAGDVQMAPDGQRVAYVSQTINREENRYETAIYMQKRGEDPVRFTMGPDDSQPRFSPNNQLLAFLSRRGGTAQVWLMSLAGGEARQLTDAPGDVSEFSWSPDGKRLAFICQLPQDGLRTGQTGGDGAGAGSGAEAGDGDVGLLEKYTAGVQVVDELLHKMDGVGYFGAERPCLCVMSLDEPQSPVQLTEPPYSVSSPVWSPDGERLFVKGRLGADYDRGGSELQIWAVPAAGGAAEQVSPPGLSCRDAVVSPDGATVAIIATYTDEMSYDNAGIFLVPLAGGEATQIVKHWDAPFDDMAVLDLVGPGGGSVTWSPDGKSLFSVTSVKGTSQLAQIDIGTDTVRLLTEGDRVITSFSFDAGCKSAALTVAEALSPSNVHYLDVDTGREEQWTALNKQLLSELQLSPPERFQSHAENGPAVDGWIIKPHDLQEGQQYPALLSIHGGPALMYTSAFFFEFQLLAANGYGVIYSNPRGSHSYGEQFCKAIQWEWGGADYDDLMATVDKAVANNAWIDPERLGVAGGSYGGFMTNWIVGHTDRFKAAVTGRSISDWRSQCGTGDLGPFRFKRVNDIPYWVDNTWYEQQSPITYVENVTTPILIEHQDNDLRCPIEQAMMWYSAIKYLDKAPVRLVIYPGESHGMSRTGKPWHRIHRLREVAEWFRLYLGSD